MKSVGENTKTRVNINIFLSDVQDDVLSDNEASGHADNQAVSLTTLYRAQAVINRVKFN